MLSEIRGGGHQMHVILFLSMVMADFSGGIHGRKLTLNWFQPLFCVHFVSKLYGTLDFG